ncbi:LuxR C-terminal-related transcriptional regulator [Streptomyces sp. NPDC002952]|uniref:helix-turn-helix transcriptional regulator n=1 Tax=Streptomyces sp. NPDC002952 TaxID=3364673 RepID=UPI0036892C84
MTQLMEVGERMPLIWVTFHLGRTEWLAGRVRTAHRLFTEALALSSTHENAMAAPVVRGYTAASAALCGDLGPAGAGSRPSAQDEPARRGFLCGEERLGDAWRAALGGRVASARQILRGAVHSARETGHVTSAMLLLTDLARLGAPREAHEQLAELLPRCDGALAPARVRFAAALATGEPVELERCAEALAAVGARLQAAEAAAVASARWREGGQHRRATAAAHTAQNNLLRCEGISTPLLTRSAAVTPLTDRETQIALMVTEGMRSHDIAERLFLSKRTVTNHLQRAYRKLGVTSRGELRSQFGGV